MSAADQSRMDAIITAVNREYAVLATFSTVMNFVSPIAAIGILLLFRF